MGFFSRLFRRKRGGTLVGNLIRSVARHYTGGILGSGAGLKRWESRQSRWGNAFKKFM